MKKIFISHSSLDSKIGESLLDALVELGISKDEVFYSSNFHTGVGLGRNFPNEVKENLKSCELIIFILTKNFYRSPFCMNEMGVAWAFDKPFIPILLDGLEYKDMQGFIDNHYIAIQPNKNEMYKVFSYLKDHFNSVQKDIDVEEVFDNFISTASTYVTRAEKEYIEPFSTESETEIMIMKNRFTENEILLLNFFRERQNNQLNDTSKYNYEKNMYEKSEGLVEIEEYASLYGDFNYNDAVDLLVQSGLAKRNYDYDDMGEEHYISTVLNIDCFRDLISLSEQCAEKIDSIKSKNKSVNFFSVTCEHTETNISESENVISNNEMVQFIKSNKMTEIDALLLKYMIDTKTYILGDRWKAEKQIEHIRFWEEDNDLQNRLSRNYVYALNKMKFKNFVNVYSNTSYGNPREWILVEPYKTQLFELDDATYSILEDVAEKNRNIDIELPF